jgi:hypothetical protein
MRINANPGRTQAVSETKFISGQAKSLSLSIVAHLEEATPHSDLPKGLTCYLTAPATLQTWDSDGLLKVIATWSKAGHRDENQQERSPGSGP